MANPYQQGVNYATDIVAEEERARMDFSDLSRALDHAVEQINGDCIGREKAAVYTLNPIIARNYRPCTGSKYHLLKCGLLLETPQSNEPCALNCFTSIDSEIANAVGVLAIGNQYDINYEDRFFWTLNRPPTNKFFCERCAHHEITEVWHDAIQDFKSAMGPGAEYEPDEWYEPAMQDLCRLPLREEALEEEMGVSRRGVRVVAPLAVSEELGVRRLGEAMGGMGVQGRGEE